MPRLTLVRYATKPEFAAENEALARAVFTELKAARPEGVAYLLFRSGAEWIHLFVNTGTDDASALTELPAFKAYSREVSRRCTTPPEPARYAFDLLESYGLAAD
jgi:hypothetical protein